MTCVNALNRAFLISTYREPLQELAKQVSMPSIGLSSFLQLSSQTVWIYKMCVNALNRAFLISTRSLYKYTKYSPLVSMPSIGLSSFLQRELTFTGEELKVSMPSIGLSSFLQNSKSNLFWKYKCQCPQSGFPHFYVGQSGCSETTLWSVNALNRAFLISTWEKGVLL